MTPTPRVSRRTLVHGAAWSVPAAILATQAPALAVSSCVEENLDFRNAAYTRTNVSDSQRVGRYSWTVAAGTLELVVTSDLQAGVFFDTHLGRSGANLSGTGRQGLYQVLYRTDNNNAQSRQSFQFLLNGAPTTVENFQFEFGDIDSEPRRENLHFDTVLPSSKAIVSNVQVTGNGTAASPYTRNTNGAYDVNNSTSSAGNVAVRYDSVSDFSIVYNARPINVTAPWALTTHFIPKTLTLPCPEPA